MDVSLRFLAYLTYTPIAIGIALYRPLWGLYALIFLYYFRPDVWGTPDWFQPVYWISVACIVGWAIHARDLRITPSIVVASLLLLTMIVSSFTAVRSREASFGVTTVILKLIVMMFLVTQLVRNIEDLKRFLWVNIFGNIWNTKSVIVSTIAGGGSARVDVGSGQGGGANYLAMIFAMGLPLLFFRFINGARWERRAAFCIAPLYIVSIVGTGSRGGFLTVFCVMVFLIWKSNRRVLGCFVMLLTMIGLLAVMPQEKWDRFAATFKRSGPDQSIGQGESRLVLWRAGFTMFNMSPITGVGHDNYQILSPRIAGFFAGKTLRPYDPTLEGRKGYSGFVAHSTWIQSLADGGVLFFFPLAVLFGMSFLLLRRISRMRLMGPIGSELYIYSQILTGTLLGFVIAGSFGSYIKFDPIWWLLGAIASFGIIAGEKRAEALNE